MKIIFVRHGDPDYVNDTLTEKGWREANLLAERISKWNVTDFYCSPLGRAQATASCTLDKMHRTAETIDWMREFTYFITDPVSGKHGVPWDFVPSHWTSEPLFMDKENWVNADLMQQNPDIAIKYKEVCKNLDEFLSGYGYVRVNNYYKMPNKKEIFIQSNISPAQLPHDVPICREEPVIVIFCHLGAACIMLSHLLNIPFPLLTHGFFLPTTSLTIVGTEERWSNEAYFRVQVMGDTAHLTTGGEPISCAGSFTCPFEG